jgi:hypothetical protein
VQHLREVSKFQTNFGRPKYSGPNPMSFPKTVTAYGRRTLFSVEPGLVGQPQNTMKSHYSSQLQHSLTSHCVPHVTVLTYGNHDAWSMTLMRDRDPSTVYRELRCAGLYGEIKAPPKWRTQYWHLSKAAWPPGKQAGTTTVTMCQLYLSPRRSHGRRERCRCRRRRC